MSEQVTPGNPAQSLALVRKISWTESLTQHPVALWSNGDICSWLDSVALGHLSPVFTRFNGPALLSLTDRMVDEVLSTHNPAVKELGAAYEVADKVNFKLHLETLRSRTPFAFKCYNWVTTSFNLIGPRIQSDLVSKISSRTVEALLTYVTLGIAAATTGYVAVHWSHPRKHKND